MPRSAKLPSPPPSAKSDNVSGSLEIPNQSSVITTEAGENLVADLSEDTRAAQANVYAQDAQFYVYLDGLKWSRFQTASAIEAATLYGLFEVSSLSDVERFALIFFATLLAWLLMALAWSDERRSHSHLDRIEDYETNVALKPYERRRPRNMGGKIMRVVFVLLTVFNLMLIWRFWEPLR